MQATMGFAPAAQWVADLDSYRQLDVQENDMSKKSRALDAIRQVHADTSFSLKWTLSALKELRDEVNELIEAVEEDLRRQ